MRRGLTVLLLTFLLMLRPSIGQKENDENLVLVDVKEPSVTSTQSPKLAPALSATKSAAGILKGADSQGRPVIALSSDAVALLQADPTVKSVTKKIPPDWAPIRRLKVSYSAEDKPAREELDAIGVRVIEDYSKGNFFVVEPKNGQINAELISKLERNPKIRHITAVFRIKAIQSDKS